MKTIYIMLNTVEKVNNFVYDMRNVEGNVIIRLGQYFINAKSIMGVFSLDLTKPLRLEIGDWKEEYEILVRKYMMTGNEQNEL